MQLYYKYLPYYRTNLKLAVPVMVSQLGHTLVHNVDSIIVGQYAGTIPLAAVSLVNSIFTIIMVIGLGISYGLTPLIAQENGRRNEEECSTLLSNSLLINTCVGILLYLLIYFASELFIDHLGQSPQVIVHAKPYLQYLGLSIIPLMVFTTFKQFAEGLGFTRQAMMVSIWGNLINICLGITFVKGLFGIAPMGAKGVGLSTLIDRSIMAVIMAVYVFKSVNFKPYLHYFKLLSFDYKKIGKILSIGTPVALQYTFEVGAFSAASILMGQIGPVQQAAHQIAISMASATYMIASGVASAATIRTGNSYGKKDFTDLRYSAIASYHVVLLFMLITAIIFIGFNHWLPLIYTKDLSVIAIAAHLFIIAGFFQLFDGTQVVGLGVLRGIGDVKLPTLVTFLAYWIVGLPVGYWLGIHLGIGPKGIWYGLTVGLLISSVLLFFRFQHMSKKLIRVMA